MTDDRAVYVISVAAQLAGVHPQTLRIYERKGLVSPKRTAGNSRRYSQRDIERLREIHDMTQELGINLAGVKLIMQMQVEVDTLRNRLDELQRELASRRDGPRPGAEIVPLHQVFFPPWEEDARA
jgi:MerR family transcriptional regulator, heat shock protein HspR